MANPWIEHVKEFARRNKITYPCALTDIRSIAEYRAKKSAEARKRQSAK